MRGSVDSLLTMTYRCHQVGALNTPANMSGDLRCVLYRLRHSEFITVRGMSALCQVAVTVHSRVIIFINSGT